MKEETIFCELANINTLIFKVLFARYKSLNLNVTPLQSRIILFIHDSNDDVCQKDLEKYIGCNKSTLSSVLSTMEKNGFIERKGFLDDSRRNNICLTDISIEIVNILHEDNEKIENILSDGISQKEREEFRKFISKVKDNLERI